MTNEPIGRAEQMERFEPLARALFEALGLDEAGIAERKAFLRFSPDDEVALRDLHAALGPVRRGFVRGFYDHLEAFAPTRALLGDRETRGRLEASQARYFDSLTAGRYDRDYVTDRLRVGYVHHRIGLAPRWYLGAYCHYLTDLLPAIQEAAPDADTARAWLAALLKIVFLDMELALETWFHAEQDNLRALQAYQEAIVCSVPAGLLVLDAQLAVVSANRFVDRLFECGHDALVGRPLPELLGDGEFSAAARAVLEGQRETAELRITRIDAEGQARQYELTLSPLARARELAESAALGRLATARLLVVIEDITEAALLRLRERRATRQVQAVLDNVPDGIVTIDAEGRIEGFNRAAERIFGWREAEVLGENVNMLMPADRRAEHDRYLADFRTTGESDCLGIGFREVEGQRRDGSVFPLELSTAEMEVDGQRRFIGVVRDLSRRKAAEAEYAKLASAVAQTADSVVITDTTGVIEYVNPAFERITGYSRAAAVGQTPRIVRSGKHSRPFYERLWKTILAGEVFRDVFINRRRDGTLFYEEKTITPMRDERTGEITHFISTGKDITERMQMEQRLHYLAHHDALTDLPNRVMFMERLQTALGRARRNRRLLALLFLDLDRFKQINDTLGHEAGDRLLQQVARRFRNVLRQGDTVARLGGDEFALLLEDLRESDEALPVIDKLMAAFTEPFEIDGHEYFLTVSIGAALYPQDGEASETLLANADVAMYRAKEEGRNKYRFYTTDMNARALERLALESKLRRALEQDAFVLHYQPKIDLETGAVSGFEALLRWQDPELGLVSPADFIPLLEETGLIVAVGQWVLRTACAQLRAWEADGHEGLHVAVNLSAVQLARDDVPARVAETLAEIGLAAERLELEVTETVIMNDLEGTGAALERLRDLGVRLAIDDFGVGYSSLAYLKRFDIDSLKIDRSFVRDIATDEDDAAIVAAVVAMGRRLRLRVVAEGVETREQLRYLQDEGCREVQGFLFARPLPAEAVPDWLAAWPGLD